MKISKSLFSAACLFLVVVTPHLWAADVTHSGHPGTVNYVEGQAAIGSQVLTSASVGVVDLGRGQTLTTKAGKVELLLTPGVFLRVADNSVLKMVSPNLATTEVELVMGRAIVEALDVRNENDIRIDQNGITISIVKNGLYDFDADRQQVRVIIGTADIRSSNQEFKLKGGHMVATNNGFVTKPQGFEKRSYEDDFYRFSALRSGYLSEANIDSARVYVSAGPGWYGPGWIGAGWYWNPWFAVYTFVPAETILWSPFGWGFYSPIWVYRSPFFYGPHFPHRFGDFHGPYGHGYGEPRGASRR
jgi:hypothetical protein